MLALSTSWQSRAATSVEAMLAALQSLDITGIELSYRISEAQYQQLRQPLEHFGLKVVSVHNYFPVPSIRSDSKGSGDLFLLSSPENEERQNAIRYTIKTVENASELGAAAVVLHCGYVEMHHEMHVIYQYARSNRLYTKTAQHFMRNKLKERDRLKRVFLDYLLSSLDLVVPVAERYDVWLGLENRYHYHELPTFDDFGAIFAEFEGAPIGYWHDTGHAHANETLGLIEKEALLRTYADKLIGVHLHDAVGLDDHLAPGSGEIDFAALKPHLKKNTMTVIELKPDIPKSTVSRGIQFIREKLSNG